MPNEPNSNAIGHSLAFVVSVLFYIAVHTERDEMKS